MTIPYIIESLKVQANTSSILSLNSKDFGIGYGNSCFLNKKIIIDDELKSIFGIHHQVIISNSIQLIANSFGNDSNYIQILKYRNKYFMAIDKGSHILFTRSELNTNINLTGGYH